MKYKTEKLNHKYQTDLQLLKLRVKLQIKNQKHILFGQRAKFCVQQQYISFK